MCQDISQDHPDLGIWSARVLWVPHLAASTLLYSRGHMQPCFSRPSVQRSCAPLPEANGLEGEVAYVSVQVPVSIGAQDTQCMPDMRHVCKNRRLPGLAIFKKTCRVECYLFRKHVLPQLYSFTILL